MKAAGLWAYVAGESRGARGRLLFFALCLAIGVAAVVGVAGLSAALDEGLHARSKELLAADLAVEARRPLPGELDAFLAARPELERTDVRELATMAARPLPDGGAGRSRLVELKVVAGTYPFYGRLELDPPGPPLAGRLDETSAVVAPELLAGLGIALGDELLLGGATFRVTAVVSDEPDRLDFSLTLGPRVFVSTAGLARTSLEGVGNRVRYRALLFVPRAGEEELAALRAELQVALADALWVRIESHVEAQPRVRRSLERFTSYLGLVALLSLILGGTGVAQVVRTWLASRAQDIAVLRSLGLRSREILVLYLLQVLLLALAGSVAGALLGGLFPIFLPRLIPDLLPADLVPAWQPGALLRGVGLGIGVALCFTLPALTAVWRVAPALVLRSEAQPLRAPRGLRWVVLVVLGGGLFASAWIQAGAPGLAAWFTAGLLALALALFLGARAAMWLAGRVPRARLSPYVVHGLAALARPGQGTVGLIVALGLGVLVVASMGLIQARLEDELAGAVPADAPSTFLVDIQPDQWPGVRALLEQAGASAIDSLPVVMARLAEIGERPVREIVAERERDGGRARWVLTREQRLTWAAELPEDNRLVAGALWSDPELPELSVEEGYAERLGVGLGARLVFDVQGVPVELFVTSLRAVQWESFALNFFLMAEPGVLDEAPHFRIAAARLDSEREQELQDRLVVAYPNVTLLRVRPILERIAAFLGRLALGVRLLGGFTILTGVAILFGSVAATQVRRAREAALWKVLGVTRLGVVALFATEFGLCGLVAGFLGGCGAFALAWGFLELILELPARLPAASVLLASLGCAALAIVAGVAASGRALAARPLESLRG